MALVPPRERGRSWAAGGSEAGHAHKRPDIEGLRAVAILLVLPYHAGVMLLPGGYLGVDVFFVISGFVITRQLLKEVDRSGGVSLPGFYARRAKRLLPASGLVLVATVAMVWLWVPRIRWEVFGGDVVASALYVLNWRLADRSVDYLAEDVTPSPVQHFWSLAVEEQFYVVWPLFIILALWAARRLRVSPQVALCIGLLVVALPSLAWAVHHATADPERGYFVTTTRMWELAVGAFVALFAARLAAMPRRLALVLGWTGLGMVLVAARVYDTSYPWPGAYALLPTVGTALVIAGGAAAGHHGPVRVLKHRWLQLLGTLSYSLYLWHWPMIVVAREHLGGLSAAQGLAVAGLSFVPAYLSFRLVEDPLRNARVLSRSPRHALGVGVAFTVVGALAGAALLLSVGPTTSAPRDAVGAGALRAPTASDAPGDLPADGPADGPAGGPADVPVDIPETAEGGITPDPLSAPDDVPVLYDDSCQVRQDDSEPVRCSYGVADGATTVALVGDSKAGQWLPALERVAEDHDWRIITYTMSGCPLTTALTVLDDEPYTNCQTWGREVLDRLTEEDRPDVVVTSGLRRMGVAGTEDGDPVLTEDAMVTGLAEAWTALLDAGIRIVVLADTPQTFGQIYACVADNLDRLSACSFDKERGVAASGAPVQRRAAERLGAVEVTGMPPEAGAANADERLVLLDLTDSICPVAQCPPVIGNVLVYRQGSHVTATYVESLAPELEQGFRAAGLLPLPDD